MLICGNLRGINVKRVILFNRDLTIDYTISPISVKQVNTILYYVNIPLLLFVDRQNNRALEL